MGSVELRRIGTSYAAVIFTSSQGFAAALVSAFLSRVGLSLAISIVLAGMLSTCLGVGWSYVYWEYPFEPPAITWQLRDIQHLTQLSWFETLDERRVRPGIPVHAISLDDTNRVLREFAKQELVIDSATPMRGDTLLSMWHVAENARILADGGPGYSDAKTLRGFAGAATLHNGTDISFLTAWGGAESNDHYPGYEIVVEESSGRLVITDSIRFFEDVAGFEGHNWCSFAKAFVIVLAPVCIGVAFVYGCVRQQQ